jgi:hypothetical protein
MSKRDPEFLYAARCGAGGSRRATPRRIGSAYLSSFAFFLFLSSLFFFPSRFHFLFFLFSFLF